MPSLGKRIISRAAGAPRLPYRPRSGSPKLAPREIAQRSEQLPRRTGAVPRGPSKPRRGGLAAALGGKKLPIRGPQPKPPPGTHIVYDAPKPGLNFVPNRPQAKPPRTPLKPIVDTLTPKPGSAAAALSGATPPAPASPPANPLYVPPGGINPYTGKPLGPNEYVGVAGSEAENPGMVRIPPPGWWDPANPNYERRNYYVDPSGNTVAREPGYFDPDNPFDTGRPGEAQGEYRGYIPSASQYDRRMSEPGVPQWGPGKERGTPGLGITSTSGPAPSAITRPTLSRPLGDITEALTGGPTELANPGAAAALGQLPPGYEQLPAELLALIRSLLAGSQTGPRGLVR